MLFFPVLRSLAVATFSLVLTACIISPQALFDEASAITPLATGSYEEQVRDSDGGFFAEAIVTLERDGLVYTLTGDDGRDPVSFTLHDGDDGLIIAMAVEEGEAGYAILRIDGDQILHWASVCEVAADEGVLADFPAIEDDGLSCTIPDLATLTAFMTAYAGKLPPDYTFVAISQ